MKSKEAANRMGLGTRAIHAGQHPDPTTGAIMTPIYQTSTYVQSSPGKHQGYEYARTQNPTREALEACIASLEGGKYGVAFASGCAATTTLIQMLKSGDRVVCSDDVYGGTYRLFSKVFSNFGVDFRFVDLSNPSQFSDDLFAGARLVWLETPSNPLLKVIDIERISALSHRSGAKVVVDNTFMSPYWQNPLALGANIVVHSTTKYLNGHSDAIGGIILTSDDEIAQRARFLQNAVGAVPSPHDCFLVLRGLKTLHLRMRQHEENTQAIASYLQAHSAVERVIYPGLPSHPQHEVARRQARGFGGMISVVLNGGLERAARTLELLQIFALAESLGGVESLAEHPAIMTHASIEPHIRKQLGIDDGMIRLSVGVEDLADLKADLEQALS